MNTQHELNQKLQDKLKEQGLTFEPDNRWYSAAVRALNFASPLSLGMTSKEMQELDGKLSTRKPLSLFEFAIANNNIEARTRAELQISTVEYYEVMHQTTEYAAEWNKTTEEIRQVILAEFASNVKKAQKPTAQA